MSSIELEAVIESFVQMLSDDAKRSREEIAALLNRWEEQGYINRQMRAIIVQRLRAKWQAERTSSHNQE